jgi:putative glycerol-1-phosphate prenyltransferase
MNIYKNILTHFIKGTKQLAVLVDPDKTTRKKLHKICAYANENKVDYFFVGGSIISKGSMSEVIEVIKSYSSIPVILFPGNASQVERTADAILFLSLISGRNPDLLIGQHVQSAPYIKACGLEAISTGYLLIDSGNVTTVQYVSNTKPIPHEKEDIAVSTAMAGEMLGLKLIYLEAGSGAIRPVSEAMIKKVRENIAVPLIVGGGIRTAEKAFENFKAGADIIVIGNALERNPELMCEIAETKIKYNQAITQIK